MRGELEKAKGGREAFVAIDGGWRGGAFVVESD